MAWYYVGGWDIPFGKPSPKYGYGFPSNEFA